LNIFPILLPPLRERREDVRPLAAHFLERHSAALHRRAPSVSDAAWRALESHDWPGNVRELENMVERAVVMCNERIIGRQYFPLVSGGSETPSPEMPPIPGSSLEDIERYAIQKTLEAVGGNRTRAAEVLKISLRKIQYKLKEF
ncbi:MAG: sigma-54-dependent Fis family transcriptional regulator, partial [Candidatus Lindowbacteria bacterium]|nr:sigma-54-dependent Fis family transcriptional regulator [Candidatus Lindowbacteria bacterium]